MVVFEGPPGPGISETSASEVVEVCDEARVVAALDAGGRQLILVVLRERSVNCKGSKLDISVLYRKEPSFSNPEAPSLSRASFERRTRTSLKTSLNSPGGECRMKSDAMRTYIQKL